jgi:hypothetical protein
MKCISKYFIILVMLVIVSVAFPLQKAAAQGAEVSFQVFYDQLSPYGQWVDFPEEGYVWIPAAEQGFSPYSTRGYWAYTDYGWTWVSDYQWGWAPFHYGRWDFDNDYGWYWVPEYQWAPAWVAWSRSPGYYGWAPLRPGIEVNYAITNGYYVPSEHWHYVHEEFLGRRDMGRHYAPSSENETHIRNSQMINKTYVDNTRHTTYMGGPPREEVEKSTHAPVQQFAISRRSTPGQSVSSKEVSIYRPDVSKTTASNPTPAPPRVTDMKDLKPLLGRTPSGQHQGEVPTAPAQQTVPRATPANSTPPPTRQNDRVNQAPPPQTNRTVPTEPGQPSSQQNAPKNNVPPQTVPQTDRNVIPEQRQQPVPQKAPPQRDRIDRYAPPHYQAPKPNAPPPAPTPRTEAPRQAPTQHQAPPSRPPENAHPMPSHQPPPSTPQHPAPPKENTPH